jgi:glyoxylate reductase
MKPKVYVTRHLPQAARDELEKNCQMTIWDKEIPPSYEIIHKNLQDKCGLLCLLTDRIDAALMDSAPALRVISQCAVGYDNIDILAASSRGIQVGNTPGVLTDATADFTFALILSAARRIVEGAIYVQQGKWQTWGLTTLLGQDVWGATLGIIGFGRIGQAVARRARGFNMRVIYFDLIRHENLEEELEAEFMPFEQLLSESDFISLHTNLTPETRGLIGEKAFKLMKPSAVLVNTSRGPIVDRESLYLALKNGHIAAAALDVTDPEPLPAHDKLLTLPNLIIVPHIASATVTSRTKMALMAVQNLVAGVNGLPLPFAVTP